MKRILCTLVLCSFFAMGLNARILYVSKTGNDTNDGLTWATSFLTVQKALETSILNDTIFVAKGKYIPTGNGTGKAVTFKLKNNLAIYGGFEGTETSVSARNVQLLHTTNSTILSGDVSGDDSPTDATLTTNKTDNAYRVVSNVVGDSINATAYLDGFTITGGHAIATTTTGAGIYMQQAAPTLNNLRVVGNIASNGAGFHGIGVNNFVWIPTITNSVFANNIANTSGGGLYFQTNISPILNNVIIDGNKALGTGTANGGGGIYLINSQANVSPKFTNVTFSNNTAGNRGGALYNWGSSPSIKNAVITGNTAANGGGIYLIPNGTNVPYSFPTIVNTEFTNNTATVAGGGLNIFHNSQPSLINTTFANNQSSRGSAIYDSTNTGYNAKIYNSIFWGNNNATITKALTGIPGFFNCLVQGSNGSGSNWNTGYGADSLGNIDADPVFITNTFTITATSPALNAGNDAYYIGTLATDTCNNGVARKSFISIDMGAYEGETMLTPVTLLSFTAQKTKEQSVLLEWIVANEDLAYYELEKSVDGKKFETIARVVASGFTKYNNTDAQPYNGANYYRLKLVEKDGSYTYSKNAYINFNAKLTVSAYPIPARTTVTVINNDEKLNGSTATVINLSGKTIHQFVMTSQNKIDVSKWATGLYLLKTSNGDVVKLVVQ